MILEQGRETNAECFYIFILVMRSLSSCNFMLHLLSANLIRNRLVLGRWT